MPMLHNAVFLKKPKLISKMVYWLCCTHSISYLILSICFSVDVLVDWETVILVNLSATWGQLSGTIWVNEIPENIDKSCQETVHLTGYGKGVTSTPIIGQKLKNAVEI